MAGRNPGTPVKEFILDARSVPDYTKTELLVIPNTNSSSHRSHLHQAADPDNDNLGGDHEEAEPCIQTEMLERYKEWCPTPQNLLPYVPDESVMECALDSHNFLPAWHENKVVLRGNS
ncbi:hypothetical protein Vi05172_g5487 [Venturia inaequalis]|nr:hypothetical protein Vi05172_g5487 [Venturia inaequalis]